jgi:hypothetical protein
MSDLDFDPDDEEMLEEAVLQMRDHLSADHIARVTTQAEITTILASNFTALRAIADGLANLAMLLDRRPEMAKHIAKHLREMAETLSTLVPKADEEVGA